MSTFHCGDDRLRGELGWLALRLFPYPLILVDAECRVVFVNDAWEARFGDLEVEPHRCECFHVCSCDAGPQHCLLRKAVTTGRRLRMERVVGGANADGTPCLVDALPLEDETGRIVGGMEILREIDAPSEWMLFDELTGVSRRGMLFERLRELTSTADRRRPVFSVIMVDVDDLKRVNDILGHQKGDEILRILGRTLHDHTRSTDIAARYGGEEFILVVQGNVEEAAVVAERVRGEMEKAAPSIVGDLGCGTVSIGVVEYTSSWDIPFLLKCADTALYEAKKTGKNRVVIFRGKEEQDV